MFARPRNSPTPPNCDGTEGTILQFLEGVNRETRLVAELQQKAMELDWMTVRRPPPPLQVMLPQRLRGGLKILRQDKL